MKLREQSVSAYNTFMECPAKYDLHYNHRIRAVRQPSYFVFGSAMDKAFNTLLLGKTDDEAKTEMVLELKRLLTEPIQFLENDYDAELIDEKERAFLLNLCKDIGFPGDDINALTALFERDVESLSEKQSNCLAIICHHSLATKGFLMIEAYKRHVLPRLSDIKNVQKEVKWTDAKGNTFVMVQDFEAKLDGVPITRRRHRGFTTTLP
jgi:hypothetical protein